MKDDYTIILADDHVMIREGIRKVIEEKEGLRVVGQVGDGLKLLKLAKKIQPDMVILDISMPGMRGIEAAREILSQNPGIHVLILSMHKSDEFLSMALTAGARGYLLKEDTIDELIEAIDCIRKGKTYLSKNLPVSSLRPLSPSAEGIKLPSGIPSPAGSARFCS